MTKPSPFKWFKTSPEIIRLAVMLYVRFPLSLREVEDLLHERGIDISHETVRFWWFRFGPSSPPKSGSATSRGFGSATGGALQRTGPTISGRCRAIRLAASRV